VNNISISQGGVTGGFTPEMDYTYTTRIDNNSSIAYIGLVGNNPYPNVDNIMVMKVLYITLLQDEDKAFYSIAELIVPVEAFTYALNSGIDCVNNYSLSPDYCDYFESYSKIMCGAHLTTFANKQALSGR
jgi:hypothetical protein